jgi:hypothetical protein
MAETFLGATVGEWVPGNWDSLPDSIKVRRHGIGNILNGTAYTIADYETLLNIVKNSKNEQEANAEQIRLGFNPLSQSQLESRLAEAKQVEGYYVDPKTKQVTTSENLVPQVGQILARGEQLGATLTAGEISRGAPKNFTKVYGQGGTPSWGLDATGKIVQTNAPTTGQETLEETIKRSAAQSSSSNTLGEAGTVLTRGVSFSYDNMGNIVSATDARGKPVSVEEGKKLWENFFIDNPDQLTRTNEIRAGLGQGEFTPGGLTRTGARNVGATPTKTVARTQRLENGSTKVTYSDGTTATVQGTPPAVGSAVTSTAATTATNNPFAPGSDAAKAWNERKSAYDLLYSEFNKYGLGTLVTPLRGLIQDGVSPSEFTIQLRNTPQYQKRFAANQARIQKGLTALNEAEYIGLEDQYQSIMRNYGLPEQYYARGDLGVQAGFEQFIGNDVSPVELEDRIQTAERRVRFANPEVGIALKTFYPDITNGDVLAYALDPKTALESLKRRITAAEVGSTAVAMGLATNVTDAEYLARYGVTKAQAQQGYQTISNLLPRASQLADIYATQGVNPYTQATAEKEVFGVPGAADAAAQRKKIVGLETAAFSGSSGAAGGALARERAGGF